uniref:LOW QUALITY PROTEIN: calcium-responsive transactivator n=1 Tax=Camelus bactrianus TaxID=9837 RepID=A0A9W3HGH9_CAMBA|nr:LOW QUALITY PROTEIN: calcium-responsive transactivator [Camelus bactrianus]
MEHCACALRTGTTGLMSRQPAARRLAVIPCSHLLLCQMLDENHHLIQCILDYQSKGKAAECTQYQQILHRNLVYLATIADSNQNMQSLLPAPPTQSMTLGPGGLSQSGSSQSQGLHSQGSLSDAIGAGLPPSSLMQAQIGNGPNHVSMQQTAQSTLPTTSMSMSGSSHGSGPGPSHSGPASQSVPLQGQGTISNYVSRANINMQSNPVSMMHQQAASSHYGSAQGGSQHYQGQSMAMMGPSGQGSSMMGQRPLAPYRPSQQGSSQQYLGQEEYYGGEQYGHSQAASEPVSQPYYPDGHGDYAYQQSSYPEQSYDRPFEEPTQHYYEGGNSQYSQQQAGYQQGTAQQQTYSQQQYPNQQGYPGQQQGYGEGRRPLQTRAPQNSAPGSRGATGLGQLRLSLSLLTLALVRKAGWALRRPPEVGFAWPSSQGGLGFWVLERPQGWRALASPRLAWLVSAEADLSHWVVGVAGPADHGAAPSLSPSRLRGHRVQPHLRGHCLHRLFGFHLWEDGSLPVRLVVNRLFLLVGVGGY